MADANRRKGLGRGLSALMAEVRDTLPPPGSGEGAAEGAGGRQGRELPIEQVFPNPNQPRKRFAPAALEELVASIKARGVLQPILVRPRAAGGFEIVAGERRWRAAQGAQLHAIPAVVKDFTDAEVMEVALVENVQRADLTPVEEAAGYQRLLDEFGHTQEELAGLVGKSRSHVANTLRLLNLPAPVRELLDAGTLSAGHARALIGLDDAAVLARRAVEQGLSVRQLEEAVKARKRPADRPAAGAAAAGPKDADTVALENDLSAALGMPVAIADKVDAGGSVTIRYRTLDELDALCRRLSRPDD